MLPSRGLSRLRPAFGHSQQALERSCRPVARQFSTTRPAARITLQSRRAYDTLKAGRVGGSLLVAGVLSAGQLRLPSRHARYASTQPAAPTSATAPSPSAAPALEQSSTAPAGFPDVSSIDITGEDLLSLPEQIGYLKSMGLDFGWGPTAFTQSLLESIYIYTGLPWWATISLTALLIRAVLVKPSLDAAEVGLKIQALRKNPRYEALRKKSMDFQDQDGLREATLEMRRINKANNVQTWRTFIPMLQLPIFFGFFKLFRAMADLPVPSLETGGMLWFTDLAAADPYYILPICSSAVMFVMIKVNKNTMPADQAKMMALIAYVMAPLLIFITKDFPAGLQLFLCVSGVLQSLQAWVFLQPWFRRWSGLPEVSRAAPPPRPITAGASWQAPRTIGTASKPVVEAAPKGVVSEVKEGASTAYNKVNTFWQEYSAKNAAKEAQAKAKKYNEKRAMEEKERYYARREELRLRALEKKQKGQ